MKIKVVYEIDLKKDHFVAKELEKDKSENASYRWMFNGFHYTAKILNIERVKTTTKKKKPLKETTK